MSRAPTLAILVVLLSASRAEAWNPIKAAADKLKHVVAGFVESATSPAIHNVEEAGHRLISDVDLAIGSNVGRIAGLVTELKATAGTTLEAVDHSLQARILQVQTVADHTIDHAFDRIDLVIGRLEADAQQLIDRAARAGGKLIEQLNSAAAANLDHVDKILAARINDVQLLVTSAIQQADEAAQARLAQLDELAGRRLGNLDVIATKQGLSLEGMLVRIASLIGLVGLLAFVAWRLFSEAATALALAERKREPRLSTVGKRAVTRLLPQLALAGAGALALWGLSTRLPRDSQHRFDEQVGLHLQAFQAAAHTLDVIDARYHASQLEILVPRNSGSYRAQLARVELLHSLFTRPGQLHTPQGLASLVAEVAEVERLLGAEDPDVTIAKAYVLWQVGGSRDDEYEAAELCAHALALPGPALLAPLARNYLAAFLGDPYVPPPARTSLATLARAATLPPARDESHQFDRVIELDLLIQRLDRASSAAYLALLAAHAELRIALAAHPRDRLAAAVREAREARTAAARTLIDAWAAFDRAIESSSSFASDAIVLSVFTLDDAVLARARYYAAVPEADDLAPALTAQPASKLLTPALRVRIAPLRVAWERRYAALLGPNAREIVSYEEAQRFAAFEQRAVAFETAYVDFVIATRGAPASDRARAASAKAAVLAAELGLYRDTAAGRVTEASRILAAAPGEVSAADQEAIATRYRARRLHLL